MSQRSSSPLVLHSVDDLLRQCHPHPLPLPSSSSSSSQEKQRQKECFPFLSPNPSSSLSPSHIHKNPLLMESTRLYKLDEIIKNSRHKEITTQLSALRETIQETSLQIFEKIDQLQENNRREISSIKLILKNIIDTQSKIQEDLRYLADGTTPNAINGSQNIISDEKIFDPFVQIQIPEDSNLPQECLLSLSPATWTTIPSQDLGPSENLDDTDFLHLSDIPNLPTKRKYEECKDNLVETPLKWWNEIDTETDSDEYCSWKSRYTI